MEKLKLAENSHKVAKRAENILNQQQVKKKKSLKFFTLTEA